MRLAERAVQLVKAGKETELERFIGDVREGLASSNRQFIAYKVLALVTIVTYYLVSYKGAAFTFRDVQITDATLFRRVFLVVPAGFLAVGAAIGHLRLLQRDVYDYLCLARYPETGSTQLHELRLPSDYILGLFLLREQGPLGKILSLSIASLSILAFMIGPIVYLFLEAAENIQTFGDPITVMASVVTILLCVASLLIVPLTKRAAR